jgi:hypothetical protein
MGKSNSKQLPKQEPNLIKSILAVIHNKKQLETSYHMYFYFAKHLYHTLPKGTPESELESKLKEILINQIDVFELVKAYLYKIHDKRRLQVFNDEVIPLVINDDEINHNVKKYISEKLAGLLVHETLYILE